MIRTSFAAFVAAALYVCGVSVGPPDQRERAAPIRNVLVIMGDDHAAGVFGAYGNRRVRTPNLDRLAGRGIRLDRAYTNSPVCTPARQSMITGKLPHAAGVTLLSTPLAESQYTIAEHLKREGFRTGAVGKMHFVDETRRHGFDYRVDEADYQRHRAAQPARRAPADIKVKGPWRPFKDPAAIWMNADVLPQGVYDADSQASYYVRRAGEFLEQNRDNRFCLWLSFTQPHSPFDFPLEFAGRHRPADMALPPVGPEDARWVPAVFKDLTVTQQRGIIASYYTAVEYLDAKVGEALATLDRLGLADSTLIVYTSDNGYLLGDHGRFEKHTMWEPAVRIPLAIVHPRFAAGRATDALVELVDVAPTILDALGAPPMPDTHGRSLLPLLEGRTRRHRDFVFSEYLPDNTAMIRTDAWKYVFGSGRRDLWSYETGHGAPGRYERLYDMRGDPREFRNLARDARQRRRVEQFRAQMLDLFIKTDPRARDLPADLSVEKKLEWLVEPPEAPRQF